MIKVVCSVQLDPKLEFDALVQGLQGPDPSPYVVELTEVAQSSREIRGRLLLRYKLSELDQMLHELSARMKTAKTKHARRTLDDIAKAVRLERMVLINPVPFILRVRKPSEFMYESTESNLNTTDQETLAYYLGQHVSSFLQTLRWAHGTLGLHVQECDL